MKAGWVELMLLFFGALSVFSEVPPHFAKYNSRDGIVYKTVNGEALDLVLFLPDQPSENPMPLMVYLHGGGWQKGNKFSIFNRDAMDHFLKEGIACASVEYRLVRPGVSTIVDCATDCKDAVRFLVKHADEYNLDPTRMGTWGSSAGGHLCLLTALAPDELFPGAPELSDVKPEFRCVASYFPVTTFTNPDVMELSNFFKNPANMGRLFGAEGEKLPELAARLSPADYFTLGSPAVLLLHGDKDPLVHHENSIYALKKAHEAGASADLITVTNGMHNFHSFEGREISPSMDQISQLSSAFVIQHLKGE